MNRGHWDELAIAWELFERAGLGMADLQAWVAQLTSPILLVGAGNGRLVEDLRLHGFAVTGVDFSPGMVARAWQRHRLSLVCATAEKLPFEDHSFRSVILSSGVMVAGRPRQNERVLAEANRICEPGGMRIVAGSVLVQRQRASYQSLGLLHGNRLLGRRCLRLASCFSDSVASAEQLVGRWTGGEGREAVRSQRDFLFIVSALVALYRERLFPSPRVVGDRALRQFLGKAFFSPEEWRALIVGAETKITEGGKALSAIRTEAGGREA